MKLLAVSLHKEQGELKFQYKFFSIAKETPTAYRFEKPHTLLNDRVMVKKDEVDKIMLRPYDERRDCSKCEFDYLNILVWVLSEKDENDYELMRCWRKALKEAAIEQLRMHNQVIKLLYAQVSNL